MAAHRDDVPPAALPPGEDAGQKFSACGGLQPAAATLLSEPAVPYSRRGDRADDDQNFRDGGRHHRNGVSAGPRPSQTDGAGRLVSRPPPMPESRAAGSKPPGSAYPSEATARPHHGPRWHDGEASLHPRAASATLHRPRDAGRRDPPLDDAADRSRPPPAGVRRENGRALPAPRQQGQRQQQHGGGTPQQHGEGAGDDRQRHNPTTAATGSHVPRRRLDDRATVPAPPDPLAPYAAAMARSKAALAAFRAEWSAVSREAAATDDPAALARCRARMKAVDAAAAASMADLVAARTTAWGGSPASRRATTAEADVPRSEGADGSLTRDGATSAASGGENDLTASGEAGTDAVSGDLVEFVGGVFRRLDAEVDDVARGASPRLHRLGFHAAQLRLQAWFRGVYVRAGHAKRDKAAAVITRLVVRHHHQCRVAALDARLRKQARDAARALYAAEFPPFATEPSEAARRKQAERRQQELASAAQPSSGRPRRSRRRRQRGSRRQEDGRGRPPPDPSRNATRKGEDVTGRRLPPPPDPAQDANRRGAEGTDRRQPPLPSYGPAWEGGEWKHRRQAASRPPPEEKRADSRDHWSQIRRTVREEAEHRTGLYSRHPFRDRSKFHPPSRRHPHGRRRGEGSDSLPDQGLYGSVDHLEARLPPVVAWGGPPRIFPHASSYPKVPGSQPW